MPLFEAILANGAVLVGPSADGSANQVLATDGSGNLVFLTVAGAGGTAPDDASYVTLGTNATLTSERVLTGTSNQITLTDNGAGSTIVLSTPQNLHTAATVQFGTLTVGNTGLHVLDTDASHDLIIKPGSNLTADRTLTLTTGDADRTITIGRDVNLNSGGTFAEASHTHTESDITDLTHTDADAIHDNVSGEISLLTEKVSPVNADLVIIEDSEASNAKKKVQVGNLPGGGGGAPTDATYLVTAADGTLTNEVIVTALTGNLAIKGNDAAGRTITLGQQVTNADTITIDVPVANVTVDGAAVVTVSATQTLTNKTLTTPTIGSFTNATHNHQAASGGGQLDHGAALTGLTDDDHTIYALLAGRSGGQTLIGGTGVGDDLTLQTTSNVSKGSYIFSELTTNGFVKTTGGTGTFSVSANVDLTADVTGALPIANGGTGQTAKTAAYDALSPLTTQGDIAYHNGTNVVRLAAGTNGHFLKTQGAGANPTWDSIPGGGDMLASTYDPATISEQLVGLTATQTLTNKTLTSPVLTTPQINDTSADHQYIFAVSELTLDRTVTLPLLTGNDTFVFEAHTQTLSNKTLTTPTIASFTNATHDHTNAAGGGQLDHGAALTGLTDDDHTIYALLAGRAGGQILTGGTGAGDDITFKTTSNVSKGSYIFDEATASRLASFDASKGLVSVSDLSSWVAGTTNQVSVANDGDGTITLSTPQSIHTGATPTFAGANLSSGTATLGTVAGTIDAGSATSLEIPNSATPTVNADGEIALDTTVTDWSHGIIKYYGGEEMAVVAMPVAQLTTPTNGHVIAYNATNDEFELVAQSGGGDMSAATYDPATIAEQLVGLTATQTLTNKTLTSPVLTTPQINDTSADHQYIFAVSELTLDRTVTLPLLTGNDTFVFEAHTQTLTNKTLTSPTINGATLTGVLDAGGATSFEVPNSATPTVDADGEIAVDTTVTDFSHGILKYYGGEEMAVVAMPIAQLTTPTDGHVVAYNATNDEFELVAQSGGGTVYPQAPTGRLTLATGDYEGSGSAATTLYYTGPGGGNFQISLYDGTSAWNIYSNAQISIAVPSTTNTNYDVYIYDNSGTPTLELSAWSGANTPADTLVSQDGFYSKSGSLKRLLIGMIRTGGTTGQVPGMYFVWNMYNRTRSRITGSQTASHSYGTTAWRKWNNALTHAAEAITRFSYSTTVQGNSYQLAPAGSDARLRISSWNSAGTLNSFAGEGPLPDTGGTLRALTTGQVSCPAGHFYVGLEQYASATINNWNYAQVSAIIWN